LIFKFRNPWVSGYPPAMQQPAPIPRNIVLIGFMGCGKSTVGRELQAILGYPLVDTDAVIENRAGKPITRIFAEDGEAAFRDQETCLLRELADATPAAQIIATGGGIVARPENRECLKRLGYVVWLRAPIDVILQRTRRNQDRPLLHTEDPAGRIQNLLEQRDPWYRESAHLRLDTAGLSSREIATGILESARYYFSTLPQPPCQQP
jgi:shikimate kinase